MTARLNAVTLLLLGSAVGLAGLGLGAYLASGSNGWSASLLYSVLGLVGAPMAALSWTSRRSVRCQLLAGGALLLGVLGSMGVLLELSQDFSAIAQAWSQVPFAVVLWVVIWLAWEAGALARLIWFEPPRTRGRLSSRRGDSGL